MQPKKTFVTNYKARNIYKVIDGIGNILYIAEPSINGPFVTMSTKVNSTLEALQKDIDQEVIFQKLNHMNVR